jgi:hypothetical protein
MTNRNSLLCAAALCAAGLLAAGGLAVELQPPQVNPLTQSFKRGANLLLTERATGLTVPLDSVVIQVAPAVIRASSKAVRSNEARDLSEMHCGDWRALEQGPIDMRVRFCS